MRCGVGHDCSTGGHSGRTRRRSRVSEVEPGVSPLLQEWADEALGLAVGLRSVGAGRVVPDPQRGAYREGHTERLCGLGSTHAPHRKRLRTTNVLERLNQEIKRRANVVRIFPGEEACLRLVTALTGETSEEWVTSQGLPGYGASRGDGGSTGDTRNHAGGETPARYRLISSPHNEVPKDPNPPLAACCTLCTTWLRALQGAYGGTLAVTPGKPTRGLEPLTCSLRVSCSTS